MSEVKTASSGPRGIVGHASVFAFSSQITQLITLIAAILSRRFLGPTQVGIWATLQIVVEYSKYSTMGALYSVAIQIPYLIGKGKTDEAEAVRNAVFTLTLFNSVLAGIAILGFALVTFGRWGMEMTYGLILVSIIVVLQRMSDFLIGLARCYKKFVLASKQMIWSAIVNVILVSFLSYRFKIYGFIWAIVLSLLFNILYIQFFGGFTFRLQLDRKRTRSLLTFGLPLMVIALMMTGLRSIDRMVIAKTMNFEALGFYSVAYMVSTYIQSFFYSIAVVLVPHLQERFSVKDDPKDLKNLIDRTSQTYLLIIPALIGLAWTAGPYFISVLLPHFTPGIEAMKMLCLSMLFLSLVQSFTDLLIAIRKHLLLFPLMGATVGMTFFLTYTASHLGYGISGIASATALAALFNFTIVYFFASRYLRPLKESIPNFLILLGCSLYLFLILIFIDKWFPTDARSVFSAMRRFLVFAAFYPVLALFLERRFSIVTSVLEKVSIKKGVPEIVDRGIEKF